MNLLKICTIKEVKADDLTDEDCEIIIEMLQEAINDSAYKNRVEIGGSA